MAFAFLVVNTFAEKMPLQNAERRVNNRLKSPARTFQLDFAGLHKLCLFFECVTGEGPF